MYKPNHYYINLNYKGYIMTTLGMAFFAGVAVLVVVGLVAGYTQRYFDDNKPQAVRNK